MEVIRNNIIQKLGADQNDPDIPIVIAGNKCDLKDHRQVLQSELEQKKKDWKCPVLETSAMENTNASEAFFMLFREVKKKVLKKTE